MTPQWLVYYTVRDCAEKLAKAQSLGAKVIADIQDKREIGCTVGFVGSDGITSFLIQPID